MMREDYIISQETRVKQLGVFELRGLAREIGIPSPTTKKREQLIKLILEKFKNGFTTDVQEKRKGRPFKKLSTIDEIVFSMTEDNNDKAMTFENIMLFAQDTHNFTNRPSSKETIELEAIVRKDKDGFNANNKEKWIYFNEDSESYKKLRQGDKVKVQAQLIGQGNQYQANQILEINDIEAEKYVKGQYTQRKEVLSNQILEINGLKIHAGKRNAIMLSEDVYENNDFSNLVSYCRQNEINLIVLGINTSFEDQVYFKDFDFDNFTTKYGTDNNVNLNVILDAISYAENLILRGKNVLIYLLDIMEIVRLSDRCFGHTDGNRSNNTMIIIQKIMELGRSFQDGGHSTMLIGYNELDKDQPLLKSEVLRVCKLIK